MIGHRTGWWALWISIAVLVAWSFVRGRLRALQYHRIAQELGFTYLGRSVPETLKLSKASFWNSLDLATNVIAGAFKGIDTTAFDVHANHGDVGYQQTTVAMTSNVPLAELSTLWLASGIRAERIGEWIVMFRPKEVIAPAQLPDFLNDCLRMLQYFHDHSGTRNMGTDGTFPTF